MATILDWDNDLERDKLAWEWQIGREGERFDELKRPYYVVWDADGEEVHFPFYDREEAQRAATACFLEWQEYEREQAQSQSVRDRDVLPGSFEGGRRGR